MADHRRAIGHLHGKLRNEQKWMKRIKKKSGLFWYREKIETMMNGKYILYKKGGLEVRKGESRDNRNRGRAKRNDGAYIAQGRQR
jgi:hypothetical protein